MVCGGPLKYNFSTASGRDDLVYGAARPGAEQQRCFDVSDTVKESEVIAWAAYMKAAGIKRVISLLTASELDTYERPPLDIMGEQGLEAFAVDSAAPGACQELITHIEGAVAANEKVVVHCWGGGGRTGQALAAWLARHYGITAAQAAQEITEHAKQACASRRANAESLAAFLSGAA